MPAEHHLRDRFEDCSHIAFSVISLALHQRDLPNQDIFVYFHSVDSERKLAYNLLL